MVHDYLVLAVCGIGIRSEPGVHEILPRPLIDIEHRPITQLGHGHDIEKRRGIAGQGDLLSRFTPGLDVLEGV